MRRFAGICGDTYTSFLSPASHPGEHLREDFLPGYKLTAGGLARAMGLRDRAQMERIVREKQAITADTALRLARFFWRHAGVLEQSAGRSRPFEGRDQHA